MNIYFACSITGGRNFESVYESIVGALLAEGHDVPTAHLAKPSVISEEQLVAPREVYDRDVNWIQNCDVLIAEVSVPSHGVGYEIGYALGMGKRVLCLYQEGCKVSKIIMGNPHSALKINAYSSLEQAIFLAKKFLVDR